MSLLSGYDFTSASAPDDDTSDSVPLTEHVEYPCRTCGKEAGPYAGRGRKPTHCPECKPKKGKGSGVRVTGSASNLAAQAAKVLANANNMLAMGASVTGMFRTGGLIVEYSDTFEQQAYQALLLDPELCRTILKTGGKSASFALVMAYVGLGVAVGPTAYEEYMLKRAARRVRMEEAAAG